MRSILKWRGRSCRAESDNGADDCAGPAPSGVVGVLASAQKRREKVNGAARLEKWPGSEMNFSSWVGKEVPLASDQLFR